MLLGDYIKKKVEIMETNKLEGVKESVKLHPSKYVWMNYSKDKLFDPLGLKRLKESYFNCNSKSSFYKDIFQVLGFRLIFRF